MFEIILKDNEHFQDTWETGTKNIPGTTPMYSNGVRAFEHEIFYPHGFMDDSFVVLDGKDVAALVPLYCFKNENGEMDYRYGGEFLRGPVVAYEPETKRHKETLKFVFDIIEKMCAEKGVKRHLTMMEPVEMLEGRCYYNYFTDFGYRDATTICQVIDLTLDDQKLWLDVRKSYRPLINRAMKEFQCDIVTANTFDFGKCEDYRDLHRKVAGRQTRSIKSFHLMYELIKASQGFLVLLRNNESEPVASHFFYSHGHYCLYASSAVDPALSPSSGVGHLGFWKGALTAREMGCKFMDMGQLYLTANPSDKEKNIAMFKKGFGGKTVAVFRGIRTF